MQAENGDPTKSSAWVAENTHLLGARRAVLGHELVTLLRGFPPEPSEPLRRKKPPDLQSLERAGDGNPTTFSAWEARRKILRDLRLSGKSPSSTPFAPNRCYSLLAPCLSWLCCTKWVRIGLLHAVARRRRASQHVRLRTLLLTFACAPVRRTSDACGKSPRSEGSRRRRRR